MGWATVYSNVKLSCPFYISYRIADLAAGVITGRSCRVACMDVYCVRSEHHREKSKSNKASDSEVEREAPLDLRAGGIAKILKTVESLFTNCPFVFTVLYGTFDAIVINGFIAFGAKFFQQQFGLTTTMASIVFGL